MARPLGKIRILFSARTLFDLEEADKIFAEQGAEEYADYMCGRGNYATALEPEYLGRKLNPGPLWNFAQALLKLNKKNPGTVEIGVTCKDTAETALPIFRNLDIAGLPTEYRIVTCGGPLLDAHHTALGTDLFLSRNAHDVQAATDLGIAAATINFPAGAQYPLIHDRPLSLFLDLDAVTFGSSSELFYKEKGLDKYRQHEFNKVSSPIEAGPFTKLLAKISQLNDTFKDQQKPFLLTALTARGSTAAARVFTSVRNLGIDFNGGFLFMGGADKTESLKAHQPDLFFDDQQVHLEKAADVCPTGHVAYAKGSPMHTYLLQQEKKAAKKAKAANNP